MTATLNKTVNNILGIVDSLILACLLIKVFIRLRYRDRLATYAAYPPAIVCPLPLEFTLEYLDTLEGSPIAVPQTLGLNKGYIKSGNVQLLM
jgi:hypothetical protein